MTGAAPARPPPVHRPWIQIPGLLDPAECAALRALAATLDPVVAEVDAEGGQVERPEVRLSRLRWIDRTEATEPLFERIGARLAEINAAHYGFEIDGMPARLQFTEYAGEGKYDWHQDIDAARAGREPHLHPGRRLSFSVQLTAPEDYEGGDFQIHLFGRKFTAARGLGAGVVFPSNQLHRVTPVTRGLRQSLVGWLLGPPTADPRFQVRVAACRVDGG